MMRCFILAIAVFGWLVSDSFGYDWSTNPGDGSPGNPYQLSTAEQLTSIGSDAALLNKNFVLINDINLDEHGFFSTAVISPDGANTDMNYDGTPFTGTFDGQGFAVRNMMIYTDSVGNDYLGLFGYLGIGSVVSNLTLDSVSISGGSEGSYYLGGLTAYSKGTIRNCRVVGTIGAGERTLLAGGLVGQNDTSIIQCSANVNVTVGGDSDGTGGLVGCNSGLIQRCLAIGNVTCYYSYSYRLGGLVGDNFLGTIENSYASGKVTSSYKYLRQIGGLAGRNRSGTIRNCFSTGKITPGYGTTEAGGMLGLNTGGTNTNCFWDTACGMSTSAGGTGKTTAEMKTLSTFTNATWDFVGESANGVHDIWRMCLDNTDYPRLSWEAALHGDYACPNGTNMDDLLALAANWLSKESENAALFNYACDADGDGITNLTELSILSENWFLGGVISSTVKPCTHTSAAAGQSDSSPRFTATVQGHNIVFDDPVVANCCIYGINLTVTQEPGRIILEENEVVDLLCTCICTFPTHAVLGPFAPGKYVFEVVQIETSYIQAVGEVSIVIE